MILRLSDQPHCASVSDDVLIPVTVKVRPELLAAIDAIYAERGIGRGQFIRDAIAAELDRLKVPVRPSARFVPSRSGVGGSPTHRKHSEVHQAESEKKAKTPMIVEGYSVAYGPKPGSRNAMNEEENPFRPEEVSSGSGPQFRRDPAGLPPAPVAGESGSGSAALRGQKISNKESLQGVSPEVANMARDGALRAARMIREASFGPARKTVASPSGSKAGREPSVGRSSSPRVAPPVPVPAQSGSARKSESSRRAGSGGGSDIGRP